MSSSPGLRLGAATALAGVLLDREQATLPDAKLYVDGLGMALFNLLVIGPLVYARVPVAPPRRRVASLRSAVHAAVRVGLEATGLVGAHAVLYHLAHRAMHKARALWPLHAPHHRFRETVTPSAANAVTPGEFLLAYMAPFAIAAALHPPAPTALLCAAAFVSACNLLVHAPSRATDALGRRLPAWWVDPRTHLEHHRTRLRRYSAPTLDVDLVAGRLSPLLVAGLGVATAAVARTSKAPTLAFFDPPVLSPWMC